MCGIAGYVAPRGERPPHHVLTAMRDALGHRGPDDAGIELLGRVALVHTRLAIVDPTPCGHQPMAGPGGRWWLAYNGEVFNHLELRAQLDPRSWVGGSDTETLVHALDAWGPEAVERCNGLYAFAALDTRGERLLLVRDRFGVKPLYWARHQGALLFASEMGALLAGGLPRRSRPEVLREGVFGGWANGPLAPLDGVQKVLPGRMLTLELSTDELKEERWYDPARHVDAQRMRSLADIDATQAVALVERELRAAVRRRLMSDVPVGTLCSGGVDSSLVTAFARDEHPDIRAYNASVVDQPDVDEGPWAEKVAAGLGVSLRTVEMSGATWRRDVVRCVAHTEYPLTHQSSVPMAQIAALAASDGVKVLLSGEGADELLGGYEWLHHAGYADFAHRGSRGQEAARAAYRALQRRGLRVPGREPPAPMPTPYEQQVIDGARRAYRHHPGARGRLEGALLADLSIYLPHLLNRQDKNTMQASIETRVPFLDPALVELALNLPLEARVAPERKAPLRELSRRYLPAGIDARPKVGFGFDTRAYIVPAARPDFLIDGRLREELGVPREEWTALCASGDGQLGLRMWTGEMWCRLLLEGQRPAQVEATLWREDPERAVA